MNQRVVNVLIIPEGVRYLRHLQMDTNVIANIKVLGHAVVVLENVNLVPNLDVTDAWQEIVV